LLNPLSHSENHFVDLVVIDLGERVLDNEVSRQERRNEPRVIAGLASKQMGQRHLASGLARLFLNLVPMVEYLAQDLVGQCALGADRRR
jgi:hypothetical protein